MSAPLLVLAGPGTGKTYQLAKRIHFLVDVHSVSPDEITVITFTRAAAKSMRNKLSEKDKPEYLEPAKQPKRIVTMHSLGLTIINEYASRIGLEPDVAVVSDSDLRGALIRDAALLVGLGEKDAKLAKRDKETANPKRSANSKATLAKYDELLRACNAVDFDDQIAIACKILESFADALQEYQALAKHLLVDEYQDINEDQYRLIKLLSAANPSGLFAVGDDDQSIYSFRGGDPSFIRNFSSSFAGAKVFQLQLSRRCLKNILDCAVAVVSKYDSGRSPKAEPTYDSTADPGIVNICSCPTEIAEAEHIAKVIWKKLAIGEARDCFVLIPNRNYLAPVVNALSRANVPHEVGAANEGPVEWNRLKIIRDWAALPSDPLLTRHLIELVILAGTTSMPSEKVRLDEKLRLRHRLNEKVAKLWLPVLARTNSLLESLERSSQASRYLGEVWSLLKSLRDAYDSDQAATFVDCVTRALRLLGGVDDFYKCLADLEAAPGRGATSEVPVRILTYNNSKGLEADCVFVIGLEGKTIPKDVADARATAEEARRIFVTMTRARRELHLHHARRRTGASTYQSMSGGLARSVFLDCLPRGQRSEQYIQAKSAGRKVVKPLAYL
jgi:superfamily I DNA/RNA helicase